MTETELLTRARQGDPVAFGQVIEAYQSPIFNLCYRMLGEANEAEDAAQEAFLRAYTQLARYDPARSFKTWLFAIASHHCIDLLRKRRITWVSTDDDEVELNHPALNDPALGPERETTRREQSRLIQQALARLAPDDRQALVLRYWYDFSYEDIADTLKTTVSAVKSRLHRARHALAAHLPAPALETELALVVER